MTIATSPGTPPRPIHQLIPLTLGLDAFATQVRELGEDLREADERIAAAARFTTLQLRIMTALRTSARPELVIDVAERLQATPDGVRDALQYLAGHGLATISEDGATAEITEVGQRLHMDLYGPLDQRLADAMTSHTVDVLQSAKRLVTAWQRACREHGDLLAGLPALALVDDGAEAQPA